MMVYGKRPYTYILYDHNTECDYLRLASTDWYVRPRTDINWNMLTIASSRQLEEEFLKLGLECEQ